jgi:copper chaperone
MKEKTFKTNINCNECVAKVTSYINGVFGVNTWEVDTTAQDKPLTVTGDYKDHELKEAVEKAGFQIRE